MTREEQAAWLRHVATLDSVTLRDEREERLDYARTPETPDDVFARVRAEVPNEKRVALTAAASALEENERLRAVLRDVVWVRNDCGCFPMSEYCECGAAFTFCPSCRSGQGMGHKSDCELARALESR